MIECACVSVCVCMCMDIQEISVCFAPCLSKTYTVCKREKARQYEGHVFTDSLSCECIMFPVNKPWPNKGASVLSARAQVPQWPDPNVVQFCTGAVHQ